MDAHVGPFFGPCEAKAEKTSALSRPKIHLFQFGESLDFNDNSPAFRCYRYSIYIYLFIIIIYNYNMY